MAQTLIYEGKAKKIFSTENPDVLLMEFKDSLTAFNALKKGEFPGKGSLNCKISTLIFKLLGHHQIAHHWISTSEPNHMTVKKTKIIPLEVVVRNILAGSLAKKLGREEGEVLARPLVEFYYKDDSLADPFVSDEQILIMGWATGQQLEHMKNQALQINQVLMQSFQNADLKLVDFKIEFGTDSQQQIILADEISPDCMRLWDVKTNEKMDKDRFRRDLGAIDQAYREVFERLSKGVSL